MSDDTRAQLLLAARMIHVVLAHVDEQVAAIRAAVLANDAHMLSVGCHPAVLNACVLVSLTVLPKLIVHKLHANNFLLLLEPASGGRNFCCGCLDVVASALSSLCS